MSGQNEFAEPVIVRYLLGDLEEEQACKLEELYFCDENFFNHVRDIEDKLIGSAGSLSQSDRALFEKKYHNIPALKARAEAANQRSMITVTPPRQKDKSGSQGARSASIWSFLWRPAFAFPALAVVV